MSDDDAVPVELFDGFREEFEPELADPLARAMIRTVDKLATARIAAATKPLNDQQKVLTNRASQKETAATLVSFGEKHPDWKDHEAAMLAVAKQHSPTGMTEPEFLEHLYDTVTAPARRAAAATHEARERELEPARRPNNASIADCFAAAKRGERWED